MGKTFQDFAWTGLQKARQMGDRQCGAVCGEKPFS